LEKIENIGDFSLFVSANILPVKKLHFQPGIRYIYNFNYKAPLVYSLNLKWDPIHFLGLRASYAKGFRAPSIKELYLDFQDINHNITGNPDLDAETGNNVNVWLDFKFDTGRNLFMLANNIYYNKINNKIELMFDPDDPTAATYFNAPAGSVISKGFSSNFTYTVYPRLTLTAGVFHNAISSIFNTNDYTRSTDFTSNLKYKNVSYGFELSVFYKYTDSKSRYVGSLDLETGEIQDVSLSYLDSYHNMDATLSIPFFKQSLRLTTGIKNIFNNHSIASSGGGGVHSGGGSDSSLLNWGRTFFIKLSYKFNKFID